MRIAVCPPDGQVRVFQQQLTFRSANVCATTLCSKIIWAFLAAESLLPFPLLYAD